MASVTSLDKDLRKMRLDKYTPAAANEARRWIEGVLGERLPGGDLLEGLKDGVALCKLANLVLPPPGLRYKQSSMPFVQMENISHFLHACKMPPLNLQEHDVFLTVDLYEQKDPAQVLQCIGAFSRAAHSVNPSVFPTAIGPRSSRSTILSPQSTGGPATPTAAAAARGRGISNASSNASGGYGRSTPQQQHSLVASRTGDSGGGGGGGGRWSPTKSPTGLSNNGSGSPVGVSSWSRKELEGATAPAWNIAQYGYMGGASQGNLGISFGGRRQITSAGPYVPNAAEKERRRKEEAERQRLQAEEEERRRKAELEAEEERARLEEERRWEEETRRLREEEKRRLEEEKRRWEEEERQWKLTEERRRKEEEEAEARLEQERQRSRSKSDARLRGQFLSQYQAEHGLAPQRSSGSENYRSRVQELEKELEEARKREAEYERERRERSRRTERQAPSGDDDGDRRRARTRSRSRPAVPRPVSRQDSWSVRDERDYLAAQWKQQQQQQQQQQDQSGGDDVEASVLAAASASRSPRPLPDPTTAAAPPSPGKVKTHRTAADGPPVVPVRKHHTGSRPLPDPAAYASPPSSSSAQLSSPPAPQHHNLPSSPASQSASGNSLPASRSDRFLASHPPPQQAPPRQTYAREVDATAERDAEDRRRAAAAERARAGGWASKSLLEREMEMERQRQREWEEAQKETAQQAARTGGTTDGVDGIGGGIGGRWDVSQWAGYTGGDSQNKGSQGIGAGRRQIVGPRPLPGGTR